MANERKGAARVVKEMPSVELDREEFERRFRARFHPECDLSLDWLRAARRRPRAAAQEVATQGGASSSAS